MIDTHAHLNFKDFDDDFELVISKAKEQGVRKIIIPSSNLDTSKKSVEIAKENKDIFAAAGFHPIHGKEFSIEVLQELYTLLSMPKVVAVGEIGLDYFYLGKTSHYSRYPDKEEQKSILNKMFDLSKDMSLPVILHCREAHQDMLNFLKNEKISSGGVVHCFSGNKDEFKSYLNLGLHISFTGNITYSDKMNDLIKFIPLDRLLLETDCPYLAPAPFRGKRNEPAYLIEIAMQIAKIKKIEYAKLEEITDKNAEKLFRLKE